MQSRTYLYDARQPETPEDLLTLHVHNPVCVRSTLQQLGGRIMVPSFYHFDALYMVALGKLNALHWC